MKKDQQVRTGTCCMLCSEVCRWISHGSTSCAVNQLTSARGLQCQRYNILADKGHQLLEHV